MKDLTIGIFDTRQSAERAINRLHTEVGIDNDEISYIYRSKDGTVREVDADDITSDTPGEGAAKGATIGAGAGALAGIAAVAGIVPFIGPLFAAGPLAVALGLSGALGTTMAGALTGAAAGGIIGALINLGVGEEHAQRYEDEVRSGNVLVAVHSDNADEAASLLPFPPCSSLHDVGAFWLELEHSHLSFIARAPKWSQAHATPT
jgi:hypothetical protein